MDQLIETTNKKIWEEGKFQDVSFSFPESENPTILKANKVILAEVSPVFEVMFFGSIPEKRNPIPIVDVEPDIFEALLRLVTLFINFRPNKDVHSKFNFCHCFRFIYTSECSVNSLEDFQKLFMVAHKYEAIAIEKYCEKIFIHNITTFDLDSLIPFAKLFSLNNLMELCELVCSFYLA